MGREGGPHVQQQGQHEAGCRCARCKYQMLPVISNVLKRVLLLDTWLCGSQHAFYTCILSPAPH
jgi:hypothetical protein